MKQKIINAYEALAEAYNAKIDTKPHNAFYDRPNTLGLLPEDLNNKKILDAACGPGKYAEILIEKGADVIGFDISNKMVELAQKRNRSKGKFFVHDLCEPLENFEDETFDIVICALALDYIEDWNDTILEFNRVLKKDGILVISCQHPFFEYTFYEVSNYFTTEAVKCVWTGFGFPIEMNCYKRSLQSCLMPIIENGFRLDKILEPKPTAEFEKHDARHFKELNEFPSFMCLRAIKI